MSDNGLEVEDGGAPAGRQAGPALHEAGAGEEQHEHRGARHHEEVLEEVQERVVGVLHVVDHEHHRLAATDPLEEGHPRREQLLLAGRLLRLGAHERGHPRSEPGPFGLVGHPRPHGLVELVERYGSHVGVDQPEPDAHRLGQGPERDALAVGQAAPAVPAHVRGQPVDVLLELPGQAGLPDPWLALDDEHGRAPRLLGRVEELLDQAQLAVPGDQR